MLLVSSVEVPDEVDGCERLPLLTVNETLRLTSTPTMLLLRRCTSTLYSPGAEGAVNSIELSMVASSRLGTSVCRPTSTLWCTSRSIS